MPNFKEHVSTGFWVSSIVNFIASAVRQNVEVKLGKRYEANIWEAVGDAIVGGTGGAIGSMIPDVFDPPTNPNHRGRFHSISNVILSSNIIGGDPFTPNIRSNIFLKSIFGGNIIHILQDSETPKGIPII